MRYRIISTFPLAVMIVLMAMAQLFFKQAAVYTHSHANFYVALVVNPWLIIGLIVSAGGMGCWVLALRNMPLSLAYPWTSLIYVITPLGGALFFGEHISVRYIYGMALVVSGVVLATRGNIE